MPDRQRIYVVTTSATEAEAATLRADLARDPLVVTAPTGEAKRVVTLLGTDPQVELLLAPVTHPQADRGHRLDSLVRRHALQDRSRDVVVVCDPATSTLLLRVLAPGQLAASGAVTLVGLPRGPRQMVPRRGLAIGAVLGLSAGFAEPVAPILALPAALAVVGLLLLLVPAVRHIGREVLLAAAVATGLVMVLIAGSSRFPGNF
ncbi:MAG: hypothetical protein JWR42_585 [Marmoricola sp.]|nr:hypothetical protein [Marmoricola sp.]